MKGKIIVITGIDGSGKETQAKALFNHLQEKGLNVKIQSFPNYDSPSAGPVNMYKNKQLGKNANDINPYQASALYIADFICTIKENNFEQFIEDGGILILDRYVESNFIHQAGKYQNDAEQTRFVTTLKNYAYNILRLPKPDITIYLDTPLEVCLKNIEERNKSQGKQIDIHEEDNNHLANAYAMATKFADLENWTKISCATEGIQKNRTIISNNIKNVIEKFLEFGITEIE